MARAKAAADHVDRVVGDMEVDLHVRIGRS
jgi:hypothetical protein